MLKPLYTKIILPADKSEDGESPDKVEVFDRDGLHFVVFNSYHHSDLILCHGERDWCLEAAVNLSHDDQLLTGAIKRAEEFWAATKKYKMVAV